VITSRRVLLAIVVFLLAGSTSLPAAPKDPANYALIFGTVWNAQNQPVYGVKVKIRRADEKKAKWELYSNHNGEFAQRVPAGAADYVVWADIKTKGNAPKPETKVHVDNDERVDISLHLTE
jgi:hypothetical protein